MKSVKLKIVAKKFCRKQHSLLRKIPVSFSTEDIHEFRVNFKKLRALLRLNNPSAIHSRSLGISSALISLYHTAGITRDLQVNIPLLIDAFGRYHVEASTYFSKLDEDLSNAKKNLASQIQEMSFSRTVHQITHAITSNLEQSTIREFVHRKVATIQILLIDLNNDEDIHSIRKHLKDLLYSIQIFEHEWHIPFPIIAWRNLEKLKEISIVLGDYGDRCKSLGFLKYGLDLNLPQNEIVSIQTMQEILQQEKEAESKKLIAQLNTSNLISDFDS